jgi:hypothetical protein
MKVKFAFFTYKGYKAAVANKRDKSTKQQLAVGIPVAAAASVSSDGSISPLSEDQCNDGFSSSISPLSEDPCHGSFSGSISPLSEEEDSCNGGFSGDKEADITTQSRFKLASGELTYFRPDLLSVVIQSNILEHSVSTRASTCSKCAQFSDSVRDPNGLIDSAAAAAQCSDSNCTNLHVAARPEGIADACDHHHPSTPGDKEEALVKSEAQKRVLHELLPPSSSLHHGIVCDAPEEEEEEGEDRGNGSSKDVEERRKSLVSAARASNALKMKWGDLDDEDVEQRQLPGNAHDKFDNLPTNTSEQDVKQEEEEDMITTADDDEEDSEENFSLKENDAVGYNSQAGLALLSILHWRDSQKLLLKANAEKSEVQGITSLLADGHDGHEFTLSHNDATAEEDERSTGLSEVRMTTDSDKNKKGVKQPSGALKLDNEDVSGSLAALAEVAYVMGPQNQGNGGAAAAETTRRGESAMKQEDDSAENTTIYLPVSSGLCTSQAGNTSMMLEHASESEYTPKSSSDFQATNSSLAAHGFDENLMHNAMEKKKKGYASLVITNVKALEDGAGEDMDLCNPDEVILTSDLLETTTSSEGLRVGTAALERGDGASVKSADQEQLTDAGTITNSMKLEKCDDGSKLPSRLLHSDDDDEIVFWHCYSALVDAPR